MKNEQILGKISDTTLAIFFVNVGDGDAIIIRFPYAHGQKACAVVDCYNAEKTINILEQLDVERMSFICATHPHSDHVKDIPAIIGWCVNERNIPIGQFWDSGFRHVSKTQYRIIRLFQEGSKVDFIFPTSGYECIINKVKITVLSPSIALKNRYDTFGTNINNASIVLKLEYPPDELARLYDPSFVEDADAGTDIDQVKKNIIILAGDAQHDAWARMTEEFPKLYRTRNRGQLIDTTRVRHNPLKSQLLKIPHHMSKHSISLEVLEVIEPYCSVVSCSKNSRHGFPHELAEKTVDEISKKRKKDYLYFTGNPDQDKTSGTVVALFGGDGKNPQILTCGESVDEMVF